MLAPVTTGAGRGWASEVLVPAVRSGASSGPAVEALDVHASGERWNWGDVLARGVLFAVVTVVLSGIGSGSPAAVRERADVRRAVRARSLPEEVDHGWPGRLAAERRRLRSSRVGVPAVAAPGAVVVAVATLQPGGLDGLGWLLAVGLPGAGALVAALEHRRLQVADRLQAELAERPARA